MRASKLLVSCLAAVGVAGSCLPSYVVEATGGSSTSSSAASSGSGAGASGSGATASSGSSVASGSTGSSSGSPCDASTPWRCGGQCVDVTADALNCGVCGHACDGGVCEGGLCGGSLRGVAGRALPGSSQAAYFLCWREAAGVMCWGQNYAEQCGPGPDPAPRQSFAALSATAFGLSAEFGCAITPQSEVVCWGHDGGGLGGPGATTDPSCQMGTCTGTPTVVTSGTSVTAGGWWTGSNFACAVDQGQVLCWGISQFGETAEMPDGGATCDCGGGNQCYCSPPTKVVAGVEVVADHNAACARSSGGTVSCWGNDVFGTIQTKPIFMPQGVANLSDAVALASGGDFFCAIRADRTVVCWGSNFVGQLGNGAFADEMTPTQVSGLSNVVEFAGGYTHACARTAEGEVWCWGSNDRGQLGNGGMSATIVHVPQLGDIPCTQTPGKVPGISGAIELTSTDGTVYVRTADGALHGWGDTRYGQLNYVSASPAKTPMLIIP